MLLSVLPLRRPSPSRPARTAAWCVALASEDLMASCLLCSATVGPHDVVCPHCGGAIDDAGDQTATAPSSDQTWIASPPPPGSPSAPTGWERSVEGEATHLAGLPVDPTEAWSGMSGPAGPGPYGGGDTPGPPSGSYGPSPYGPGPHGSVPYGSAPYGPGPQGSVPYGVPAPYGPPGSFPHGVPVYVPLQARVPTEGLAVASLVTSLAGLALAASCLLPILACPVGAVLGHMALRRIEESGKQGRGMALAGTIVGWIGTALLLAGIVLVVAVAATDGWA